MEKRQKVYFDQTYLAQIDGLTCIPKKELEYVVRIEAVIIAETDTEYKLKTGNFWRDYYGYMSITSPKNELAASRPRNPEVKRHYWIGKDKVTFIK